jgi:hypothetical protein
MRNLAFLILISFSSQAQDINVEYDKKRDLSGYKTFSLGESEVITPKDQQVEKVSNLKGWVDKSLAEELKEKGLTQVDSLGDLVATYVIGSKQQSDLQQLGPLGMEPNNPSQTWQRDYRMGSLIIDLNDRNSNLIWRINASTSSAFTTDTQNLIDQIVSAGFKKFSLKPKKSKKKK